MGFLDTIKEKNVLVQKAAAYDEKVKQAKEKQIYERGLADSANEFANLVAVGKLQELQQREQAPTPSIGMSSPQPTAVTSSGLAQQSIV